MKGSKRYSHKVVPITPYVRLPKEEPPQQESEMPADLVVVQRWLNYADIALKLPARDLADDGEKAA